MPNIGFCSIRQGFILKFVFKYSLFILLFVYSANIWAEEKSEGSSLLQERTIRPKRNIDEIEQGLKPEKFYQLAKPNIINLDIALLKKDFPMLSRMSNEQIREWIISQVAYVSEYQIKARYKYLRETYAELQNKTQDEISIWLSQNPHISNNGVNTPIPTTGAYTYGYRPKHYGRASVLPVFDPYAPDSQIGLIDIKGNGRGNLLPSLVHHKSGLLPLAEALTEDWKERLTRVVLWHASKNDPDFAIFGKTVAGYGIIDLGFDIYNHDGSTQRAVIYLRQAHNREYRSWGKGWLTFDRINHFEKILNRYGIYPYVNIQGNKGQDVGIFDFGHYTVSHAQDPKLQIPLVDHKGEYLWGYDHSIPNPGGANSQWFYSGYDGPTGKARFLANLWVSGDPQAGPAIRDAISELMTPVGEALGIPDPTDSIMPEIRNAPTPTRQIHAGHIPARVVEQLYENYHLDKPAQLIGNLGQEFTFSSKRIGTGAQIALIASPKSAFFKSFVYKLEEGEKRKFLLALLEGLQKGKIRGHKYIYPASKSLGLLYDRLASVDLAQLETRQLASEFSYWLTRCQDRPFEFLSEAIRFEIFNGNFPGLTPESAQELKRYSEWTPNFGSGQLFVEAIENDLQDGWKVVFKMQDSFSKNEQMLEWFTNTIRRYRRYGPFKNSGSLTIKVQIENLEMAKKVMERSLYYGRVAQEMLILSELQSKQFIIEKSAALNISPISIVQFGSEIDIELHVGVGASKNRKEILAKLAAQIASGTGPENKTWNLLPESFLSTELNLNIDDLVEKYGIRRSVAENAITVLKAQKITPTYLAPLWNWDSIPELSQSKKSLYKRKAKEFLEQIAKKKLSVGTLLNSWSRTIHAYEDLSGILLPGNHDTSDIPRIENRVDVGIEFSGRFQLDLKAKYLKDLGDGRLHWVTTLDDLDLIGRQTFLRELSETLAKELEVEKPDFKITMGTGGADHGHGIAMNISFKDKHGQSWRIEWDGIGRSYDLQGQVIEDSLRGGHIELVTPKFKPDAKIYGAVFRALDKMNVYAKANKGGGHINIDLAPFVGKPRNFARLLSMLHEHRGILSLMFQHVERLAVAEPFEFSLDVARALSNWTGSEDELKAFLYNNHFYNRRIGRKTRNVQFDITPYFASVIPAEYITEDFDMKNPYVKWRRQFRVDPQVFKMEARMMNAPRDTREAMIQEEIMQRFVNKALSEDDTLSGFVSEVDYQRYLHNPDLAYTEMEKMAKALDLNPDLLRGQVSHSLSELAILAKDEGIKPYSKVMASHPEIPYWRGAVHPRPIEHSIGSSGRAAPLEHHPEVAGMIEENYQNRIKASQRAFELRINELECGKLFHIEKINASTSP